MKPKSVYVLLLSFLMILVFRCLKKTQLSGYATPGGTPLPSTAVHWHCSLEECVQVLKYDLWNAHVIKWHSISQNLTDLESWFLVLESAGVTLWGSRQQTATATLQGASLQLPSMGTCTSYSEEALRSRIWLTMIPVVHELTWQLPWSQTCLLFVLLISLGQCLDIVYTQYGFSDWVCEWTKEWLSHVSRWEVNRYRGTQDVYGSCAVGIQASGIVGKYLLWKGVGRWIS